jgi:hypothetical protein
VIRHRRILVEYILQEVPVGHVDGPANGLAEVLIRFQLGVPSLRSLFFPVLRLLIRVGDTVLWGVLAVRFGLIGFHVLELPSLGNIDVVSLGDQAVAIGSGEGGLGILGWLPWLVYGRCTTPHFLNYQL